MDYDDYDFGDDDDNNDYDDYYEYEDDADGNYDDNHYYEYITNRFCLRVADSGRHCFFKNNK